MFSKITLLATLITWLLPVLIFIYFTYFGSARFSELGAGFAILICSAWAIGIAVVVSTIVIWHKTHSGAGIAGYFIANAVILGIVMLFMFSWDIKEFISKTKENTSISKENRALYANARKGKRLDEIYDDKQTKYELYCTEETIYFVEFSGKNNKDIKHISYRPVDKDTNAGYTKVYEINNKKYSLWAPKDMPEKAWLKMNWIVYTDDFGFFVANDVVMEKLIRWRNKNEYTVFDRDIDNFMQNEFLWDRVVEHEDSRRIFYVNSKLRGYEVYYLDRQLFIKKTEYFLKGKPFPHDKVGADEEIVSLTSVETQNINEEDYDMVYEELSGNEHSQILRHKIDENDWLLRLKFNGKDEGFYRINSDIAYHEIYRYYINDAWQNSPNCIIHNKTIYDEIIKTFKINRNEYHHNQ